ncbi:MAG: helix-turn-helix domain-containing protein [Sphingobacteriales bacterium]|nr:MAG: helix-turn-helix domain-containing protein [Sphingobacteriales bacterium]
MGRVNTPILSETGRKELETLFKKSDNHSLRKRCQTILLKAEGRHSKDVGSIVGMCHVSVNSWLKRYKSDGIAGLYIKPGRGKKPLIDKKSDETCYFGSRQSASPKSSYRQGRMGGFKWKRSKQEHF